MTPIPQGQFTTLAFSVPQNVLSALQGTSEDFSIRFEFSLPSGAPALLLDNLRFVASAAIVGRIAESNGTGIPSVTIALTGSQSKTAMTNSSGNYCFPGLPAGGNFTITPSKPNYTFTPANRTFSNLQTTTTADFVGTPTGSALPAPWASLDIGSVGLVGSSTYSGGTFTISGSGADIYGTADAFRFVYQPMSGDVDIKARVSSVQNTNAWAKASVMIRESLTPGSKHASMLVSPSSGLAFQRRMTTGGSSSSTGATGSAPKWVRLTLIGGTATSYWSADGVTWTQVGSAALGITGSYYVGLAVTAHNNSAVCQSAFDNVSAKPLWTKTDIGSVGFAGSSTVSGSTGTVAGSGSDVYGTADAFTYAYRSLVGDGSITARVVTQQNTNGWAKAGVMIRESLDANSKHAFMLLSPSNGLAFQRRTSTGGSSSSTGSTGSIPYWVRIERTGNTLTGSKSTDGVNWVVIGSATITMASNTYIGLAVTAHNNTALSSATFDNVAVVE